ncbi:hypothetical protein [Miltoncostaea oceani]|uniref:hypothetical protein n=1 Tax=Miltoncostaea oceani TaxID=2843216 RepID=UPI001C3C88F0|nr:hypothetical protein [Miltoncostaea oceani]
MPGLAHIRRLLVVTALMMLAVFPALATANAGDTPGLGTGTPIFSPDLPFQLPILAPSVGNNEAFTFSCVLPPSTENSDASRRAQSLAVSGDTLSEEDVSTLRRLIEFEQKIWRDKDIEDDLKRKIAAFVADGTPVASGGVDGVLVEKILKDIKPVRESASPRVLAMLNPDPDVKEEKSLLAFIPSDCPWNIGIDLEAPGLFDLFDDPGRFFVDLSVYLISQPASAIYDTVGPFTYRFTFFTPHVERGESIFNTPGFSSDTADAAAAARGYDVSLAKDANEQVKRSGWLQAAVWLRTLVSGLYILVLVGAAFLFMARGPVRNKINALEVAPLALLSIIIVLVGPILIGYGITLSNLTVGEFFRMDASCSATAVGASGGQCTTALQQMNAIITSVPSGGGWAEVFYRALALNGAAIAFLLFTIVILVRMIALIALVVLLPVASFLIIFGRRQRQWFAAYVAALAVAIFLPVGMALILRIGLALNPLTGDITAAGTLGDVSTGERLIGLLVLMVTFWGMLKLVKFIRGLMGQGQAGAGFRDLRRMGSQASVRARAAGGSAGGLIPGRGKQGEEDSSIAPGPSAPSNPMRPGFGRRGAPGVPSTAAALGIGGAAQPGADAAAGAVQGAAVAGAAVPTGAEGAPIVRTDTTGRSPMDGTSLLGAAGAQAQGATPVRRPVSREQYESAMRERRDDLSSAVSTGSMPPAREWLPVQDGDEYYLEQNMNFDGEPGEAAGVGAPAAAGARVMRSTSSEGSANSYVPQDDDGFDGPSPVMIARPASMGAVEGHDPEAEEAYAGVGHGVGGMAPTIGGGGPSPYEAVPGAEDLEGPLMRMSSPSLGGQDGAFFDDASAGFSDAGGAPSVDMTSSSPAATPSGDEGIDAFFTPEEPGAGASTGVDADLGERIGERVDSAVERLGEGITETHQESTARIVDATERSSAMIGETTDAASAAVVFGQAETAQAIGGQIADSHADIAAGMSRNMGDLQESLSSAIEGGMAGSATVHGERIAMLLAGGDKEMGGISDLARNLGERHDEMRSSLADMSERFSLASRAEREAMMTTMLSRSAELRQLRQEISGGHLATDEHVRALGLGGVADDVDESLRVMDQSFAAQQQSLEAMIDRMRS